MTTHTALYARPYSVSVDEQLVSLHEIADRLGWEVISIHTERTNTERRRGVRRSGLAALLDGIDRCSVDQIAVLSVCAFADGTQAEFIDVLRRAAEKGIAVRFCDEQITTADLDPTALRTVLDLLWNHRKAIRRDRIRTGQQRARQAGVAFGRPRVSEAKLAKVREILAEGKGIRETARATGLSAALVHRIAHDAPSCRAGPTPSP